MYQNEASKPRKSALFAYIRVAGVELYTYFIEVVFRVEPLSKHHQNVMESVTVNTSGRREEFQDPKKPRYPEVPKSIPGEGSSRFVGLEDQVIRKRDMTVLGQERYDFNRRTTSSHHFIRKTQTTEEYLEINLPVLTPVE